MWLTSVTVWLTSVTVWLTSVTVWLFCREGVAKSPCRCGSVSEIYTYQSIFDFSEKRAKK